MKNQTDWNQFDYQGGCLKMMIPLLQIHIKHCGMLIWEGNRLVDLIMNECIIIESK